MIDSNEYELAKEFNQRARDVIVSDRKLFSQHLETFFSISHEEQCDNPPLPEDHTGTKLPTKYRFEDELSRVPSIDFLNNYEQPEKN